MVFIRNNKIKKMKHLKRFWHWLLGKTTIDEKIEAKVDEVVEEVKERVDRIKEEIYDYHYSEINFADILFKNGSYSTTFKELQ